MDIEGAKALKKRLGQNGTDDVPRARADVSEHAPPVYHWVGVDKLPSEAPPPDAGDDSSAANASLFARLGLSFR